MEVFLYNSTVCRLCGEENDNGTFLYSSEENNQNISDLVNAFMPIKVQDDGQLPRTICPGCTIQLEATVEFINLIINGQKVIRALHQREIAYKKTVLNADNEQVAVTENFVSEVNIENGVYQPEHSISLQVAGLDKPKRKRGRPPKKHKTPEELAQEAAVKEREIQNAKQDRKDDEPSGKRKRKTPSRFHEVVQGKELEKIFIEEGVTDGEDSEPDMKPDVMPLEMEPALKIPEVIGHTESGELVVVVKGKGRGRPKGRLNQKRQKCAICDKEFFCSGRYMSHVAQHGPVMYQCKQCSETFPTRLDFTKHQDETGHEGQTVIPCEKTPKENVEDLTTSPAKEPIQQEPHVIPVDINQITNVTAELPDLNPVEDNINTDNIEVSAEMENVEANVNKDEDADGKPQDGKEPGVKEKVKLPCPHCDKVFSSKQSKSMHIKAVHRGERPYACGSCDASFAYPRALALHAVRHRRARGYGCDLCGKVLNHPSSVTYHKEAEHAGQKFVCNKCGKSFKHKQLLQRHQLVHTQHRPYLCKICNSSFKTKANLFNHQLLHSGVKKHSCDLCKQKFAHKTSLTLHMRWHNGQKPYVCSVCGKAFSQKGNLSEHARIHTGEKPFQCAACPRRFTTSSQHRLHLRRHNVTNHAAISRTTTSITMKIPTTAVPYSSAPASITHQIPSSLPQTPISVPQAQNSVPQVPTSIPQVPISSPQIPSSVPVVPSSVPQASGSGRHKCTYCGRACASRWALTKHTRRHTGERPFKCPHCSRAFADCSNLNKHKKQVHKQTSLLTNQRPKVPALTIIDPASSPEPETEFALVETSQDETEERVIYVTYDVDDPTPDYQLVNPEQAVEMIESQMSHELYNEPPKQSTPQHEHMSVTDEQGNPLHFTMQDGTQLAITSLDGQSLQVITQDGQTIPVEINGFAPQEIELTEARAFHQLTIPKTEEEPLSPVTHYYTIV